MGLDRCRVFLGWKGRVVSNVSGRDVVLLGGQRGDVARGRTLRETEGWSSILLCWNWKWLPLP